MSDSDRRIDRSIGSMNLPRRKDSPGILEVAETGHRIFRTRSGSRRCRIELTYSYVAVMCCNAVPVFLNNSARPV